MQEAEEALSGYVFDEFLDSLATSPPDYDAHESASNVLSLTCETADNAPNEIALVIKETQGKSELESDFEMPSGPVSDAEIPPVSVAGVDKSRYRRVPVGHEQRNEGYYRVRHVHCFAWSSQGREGGRR